MLRARHANRQETGPERMLTKDERRTASGTGLLCIRVSEHASFSCQAVNVGRLIAHHAMVVGADVEHAHIIAPDDKDVRFVCLLCNGRGSAYSGHRDSCCQAFQ